jgi:hypothetical protein
MIPSISEVGKLVIATLIIMIMIYAIKQLTKNVNIPVVREVVDNV